MSNESSSTSSKSSESIDLVSLKECEDVKEIPVYQEIDENIKDILIQHKEKECELKQDEETCCYDKFPEEFTDLKKCKDIKEIIIYPKIDSIYKNFIKRLKQRKIDEENDLKRKQSEKKNTKKRYYWQPGIMAIVDKNTNDIDIKKLLMNGTRMFLLRLAYGTAEEIEKNLLKINTGVNNFHLCTRYKIPISLAVEIRGDVVRIGRLRNDKPLIIENGTLITLTLDKNYRLKSVKEIIYVCNLYKYLNVLKLNDLIFMNDNKIQLKIKKILNQNITVCVVQGGEINSYDFIELPYYINSDKLTMDDLDDIRFALINNADFIVIPSLRTSTYLKLIKNTLNKILQTQSENNYDQIQFISNLNVRYLGKFHIYDVRDIIDNSDAIWIDELFIKYEKTFCVNPHNRTLIDLAQSKMKPIITLIPIKTSKDFRCLEMNKYLQYLETIIIEKSLKCNAYPLIAKRLLPIEVDFDECLVQPIINVEEYENINLSPQDGLINSMQYTIRNTPCEAVIASASFEQNLSLSFSDLSFYCPIIYVVDRESYGKKLNIRRNIKSIVCEEGQNIEEDLISFGLKYGKDSKLFSQGDFVLTFFDQSYISTVATKLKAFHIPREDIVIDQTKLT